MSVFKGEDGKLYIDSKNFNYEIFFKTIRPVNEFSKKYHVSKQVLHDLKERKPPSYDLIVKLCRMNNNLILQELVNDYTEEKYEDLDLDLNKLKPTQSDLNETLKQCKLRMSTIKHLLDSAEFSVEKKRLVFENVERLTLECQFLGIQLKECGQEKKVVDKVQNVRTERGVCKK